MPKSTWRRAWIKLYIEESLTGTIREELSPAERSVWYDLLLLAGRNRPPGSISANENTPLSTNRIASILNVSKNLVVTSLEKFEQTHRIEYDLDGVIKIVNWENYQYSDYDRQKQYRQKGKEDGDENLAAMVRCYEENIGQGTPVIYEELKDMSTIYAEGWFQDAVAEAVKHEKRNINYVKAILKRWQTEGRGNSDKPQELEKKYEVNEG